MLRDIDLAFIKLHILHHAAEEEVFGVGLIEELGEHGYDLGPGTLYPTLAKMVKMGLLTVENRVVQHKRRKYYRITPAGQEQLDGVKHKLKELYHELIEEQEGHHEKHE
jgi:DNA-binding PadR family transcriptional regulator